MKCQSLLATVCAVSLSFAASLESFAADPGVILITTRKGQDMTFGTTDAYDQKGPGQLSQGDSAMAELLGDFGYSSRLMMDVVLNDPSAADFYLNPPDTNFKPILIIVSGSSGSADIPKTNDKGVPVLMGEHSCLGARTLAGDSSIYMYNYTAGSGSGNIVNPTGGQYMRVTEAGKNHPILKGIPLDAQDRVKIFRDPYPEENAFVPPNGKPNYEYSWTAVDATTVAGTDTQILGLLDSNTAKSVFAVNDIGGKLGNGEINTVRLVHWIVNEDGSGGSRRMFNALTDAGRTIFIRTVKWALGETLQPVQSLRIKDITTAANGAINLRWDASALKNYKILATTDVTGTDWQTIVEDVHGLDGVIARQLDINAGPMATFLKIRAVP